MGEATERYALTNVLDGWMVRDLARSEARAVVAILSPTQKLATRVWTEGWSVWKPVDSPECSFLLEPRVQTQNPPQVVLGADDPYEITQVHISSVQRSVDGGPDPRRHHRFEVQIPVTVQSAASTFQTITEDVSEGGIRLRDPLPEVFAGYCQLVFNPNDSESIAILANPVEDQQNQRVHFEFVDSEEQRKFIEWMRAQSWAKAA